MVAAGLSAPPTGPPAGKSPPLLVGRFWFSDLEDWVSSQSVQLFRRCLWSRKTKVKRDRQNSLRDTWKGRSSKLPNSSRSPKKSWQTRCPLHSQSCASPADIFRRLFNKNKYQPSCRQYCRQRQWRHTFACDEGDKLAHAFLHALLRFLGNFGILGQCGLHNSSHWSKVADVSI